jgi:hypothetical protein
MVLQLEVLANISKTLPFKMYSSRMPTSSFTITIWKMAPTSRLIWAALYLKVHMKALGFHEEVAGKSYATSPTFSLADGTSGALSRTSVLKISSSRAHPLALLYRRLAATTVPMLALH